MNDATIVLFLENAAKAAAGARRVDGAEGLRRALAELVPPGSTVFCPGVTELEKEAAAVFPGRVPDYRAASVTVEEVHGGIAETGSLVCSGAGGKAVQAGLLPSHHVAIVPRGRIYATLDDFFSSCRGGLPANVTLVTGPSRTADIELTLAIGVHGPERLDVIVG